MRYSLHVTNNCNLRCVYCYEDDKLDKNRKQFIIAPEEIEEKMTKILLRGDCTEVELLGGEIFLYPDRLEYIFANYHDRVNFTLTTNATLRSESIDALLKTYRPSVSVSLDDPLTVERQRIGLDFARALTNTRRWCALTEVGIAVALNPLNLERLKEIFDFYIEQEGFERIHFGCVEEWMNDYYWQIYKQETARLIQNTPLEVLQRVRLSPWQCLDVFKKEFIFEEGVEKIEIFNNRQVEITPYLEAKYYGYCLYCERLGCQPQPMVPEGVEVVAA